MFPDQWKTDVCLVSKTSDVSFSLQTSEEDKVLVCCLDVTSAAIRKSHEVVQSCFDELCQAAVKTICQVQYMSVICTEYLHVTRHMMYRML